MEVLDVPRPSVEHAPVILSRMQARFAKDMGVALETVPMCSEVLQGVERNLEKNHDLRRVWSDVRAELLEGITGHTVVFPTVEGSSVGFRAERK
jgi:hypothetical protein